MKTSTALVLGAGMAGLSIAGLLTKKGCKVRVLEADSLASEARPHTFQRRYFHIVSAGGLARYCDAFPGLEAKMDEVGAPRVHWTADSNGRRDVRATYPSGDLWVGDMGFETRNISRECFERLIREVAIDMGIEFIDEQVVESLLFNGDLTKVIGVATRSRDEFYADIVIDARGRNSKLRHELAEAGYTLPDEIHVDPHLIYASAHLDFVDVPELVVGITESKEHPFGAGIQKAEDGYLVILFSMGESSSDKMVMRQVRDLDTFKRAAGLINPTLTKALEMSQLLPGAEVLVAGGKSLYNRRIPFEMVTSFPEGLYALGDVIQSHNPRYGQGQAAAILQATVLTQAVEQDKNQLEFYQLARPLLTFLWQLPTGADFRFATTTTNGPVPNLKDKIQAVLFARLEGLMPKDERVAVTLMRVLQDLDDSSEMEKPWVIFKILGSYF